MGKEPSPFKGKQTTAYGESESQSAIFPQPNQQVEGHSQEELLSLPKPPLQIESANNCELPLATLPKPDEFYAQSPRPALTKMERCVARLISLGCTVAEAGVILYRSKNTVDNHKSSAMKKLGTHNVAEFTRRVLQDGISTLDDRLSPQEQERRDLARASKPRKPR